MIIIHEHVTMIRQQEQEQTRPWGRSFRLRESDSSVINPWRGDAPAVQDLHSEKFPPEHPVSPRARGSWCTPCPCCLISPYEPSLAMVHPNPQPVRNLHKGASSPAGCHTGHTVAFDLPDHPSTFYFSKNMETTCYPSPFHLCLRS